MNRVRELTAPCLQHVFLLRSPGAIVDVERFRGSARACVANIETGARQLGMSAEAARLAKYAVAAFLDEVAQARPGLLADYWVDHLLQREFFHEVRAGEGFFVHLERLLDAPPAGPDDDDVLEIYALCLFLGFRGKFALRAGAPGFDALLHRVRSRLAARLAVRDTLEPPRPAEWRAPRRVTMAPVWIAALALLATATVGATYRHHLSRDAERLAAWLTGETI